MKKLLGILTLLMLSKFQAQTWTTDEQYVQNFASYAVEEMEKYKIPASITLAQGLLETGGGQSILAQKGKNHFGIKCKEDWTGKTMKYTDDAPNECFRVYDDPKQSYEDHSKFLKERKYYTNLFSLDMKDYKGWAFGLKKAGYATNPKYATILLGKIEKYKLYEFDNTDSKNVLATILKLYPDLNNDAVFMAKLQQNSIKQTPKAIKVPYQQSSYAAQQKTVERIKTKAEILNEILIKNHPNGGMKFVIIPEDTNITFISNKFNISESKLLRWNELENGNLKKNDIIFLESKRSEGNVPTYKAELGDNMHAISQKFGIYISKLYSKNRMKYDEEPKVGDVIYLQDKKPRN